MRGFQTRVSTELRLKLSVRLRLEWTEDKCYRKEFLKEGMSRRLHWMLYKILIIITFVMQRAGAEKGHATEGENRCKRLLSALRSVQSFAYDTPSKGRSMLIDRRYQLWWLQAAKMRKAVMVPAIKAQKLVAILSRCCPDKRTRLRNNNQFVRP